jgi:uncharacterized protein (TIGR02246 family)
VKALEPKIVSILLLSLLATLVSAQTKTDEAPIRKILEDEVTTWNRGDADGYSRHFAVDGTFTNVQGMFVAGYKAFRDRHEEIFKGQFRGTVLQLEVVSLRFIGPDVAVVDTLSWVSGFSKTGPPPDLHLDPKGRLRTRLLLVLVRDGSDWKITVYHNVDIKPRIGSPEPSGKHSAS